MKRAGLIVSLMVIVGLGLISQVWGQSESGGVPVHPGAALPP